MKIIEKKFDAEVKMLRQQLQEEEAQRVNAQQETQSATMKLMLAETQVQNLERQLG